MSGRTSSTRPALALAAVGCLLRTFTRTFTRTRTVAPVAVAVACLTAWTFAAPAPAAAAQPDDCPTFFPDFRCDRSGRYEGFGRPIMSPFLFEDPFITTGIYPYYTWHQFPKGSALDGGDVHAVAVQARVAITDRLAFIATKDGFVIEDPGSPLLDAQNGFLNLAGGFKYALVDMPERNFIMTPAARIEWSTGSRDVFEGESGGIFIPSVSAAWGVGDLHLIGGLGGHVPFAGDKYSHHIFYHLYADYSVAERFQPFVQVSGIHYVDSGSGGRVIRLKNGADVNIETVGQVLGLDGFEGVDLHNIGGNDVAGNDIVTLSVGTHVPITKRVSFSVGYERPITRRRDIFKQRVMTSLTLEY